MIYLQSLNQKDIQPTIDITIDGQGFPLDVLGGGDIWQKSLKMLRGNFIEIINHSKSNDIIGVVYSHPSMCVDDFNNNNHIGGGGVAA